MSKIFEKLGNVFEKRPFKSLFMALIVFAIMIVGALKVGMSTGSETLVQTDNDAYISNFKMEETFGSDAIMVLFEGDKSDLLGLDNLTKLYHIEQKLQYTEGIFTIMSPASVVHQITDKQISEIKSQVPNMSEGLSEIGTNLQKIGKELASKDLPNPNQFDDKINDLTSSLNPDLLMGDLDKTQEELSDKFVAMSSGLTEMGSKLVMIGQELGNQELPDLKEFEAKFNDLSSMTAMFDNLMTVQDNLNQGINEMSNGLKKNGSSLSEVSKQLFDMSNGLDETMKQKLQGIAKNLEMSANGLNTMSKKMAEELSTGPVKTSHALETIKINLGTQLQEMKEGLSAGGLNPKELNTMANGFVMMGENLKGLSAGMSGMDISEMLPNTSTIFANLKSDMNKELEDMKSLFGDGLDPEELKTMADGFQTMGENLVKISDGLEMFSDKSEMVVAHFPHNAEELENILYEEDQTLRAIFDETVIDENHIMMMIKLDGNIDDTIIDSVYDEVKQVVASEDIKVDTIISGKPVLDSALRTEMKSNMVVMIVSAVVLMFVILAFIFKVRWRVLSIGIVFISVIATLGLMGHLSVSMTMVSMAVFPILIGLGIDYSIQLQNRYEEDKSITIALVRIGKAIAISVVVTVLGFISLYASPVPMIQDFGKMLTIGVVVSFAGSVFLLMPILKARDLVDEKDSSTKNQDKDFFMDKLMSGIGRVSSKLSWLIVLGSLVLAGLGLIADQKVGVETDIETFMPQDMVALHDIHKVRDIVGSTNQMNLYFEDANILSKENIEWTQSIVEKIEAEYSDQIVDIKSIDTLIQNMALDEDLTHEEYLDVLDEIPKNQLKMFINEDKDQSVILMNVEHMATEELQTFVEDMYKTVDSSPMKVSVAGKSVLDVEMVKGLTDGRMKMTLLGLGLVFVALLVLYRSFFKALVVVFPVVVIVGMSGGVMYLLGLKYTPITATLGALILGMGTQTNIMLLERYLEERSNGKDKVASMDATLINIGAATLASGFTTLGGFSVLMTSKFEILKDFGLMTVINISLEILSTFILLPAVIWLLDRFLYKNKKVVKP